MKSKYNLVKEEIRSWMLEGIVGPHQKISSENELVKQFNVSRQTIRQAIGELVNEGWLYRIQGKGTFCADRTNSEKKKSEKTIGVITTYISNYIFPSIIRGIESYLSNHDYTVLLASTNNNIDKEKKCLQNILTRNIDGLIVEPTKSAIYNPNVNYYFNLERNHIPYIMLNASYPELGAPSIILDDELGGFMGTEHLIELGHERIAGIFKTDDIQGVNRLKGYIRAHRQYRRTPYPGMLVSFTTEEIGDPLVGKVQQLLDSANDRPTAIFCYNDEIALHVLNVIRELDYKVPEDISIIGYDNSHLAEASEVKLTTIQHPQKDMGEKAAQLLLETLESKHTLDAEPTMYQPELIVRTSTKKLK